MLTFFSFIALFLTSILCGAALHNWLISLKTIKNNETDRLLIEIAHHDKTLSFIYAVILVISALTSFIAWVVSWNQLWFIGTLILISNIAYTFKTIQPLLKDINGALQPRLDTNTLSTPTMLTQHYHEWLYVSRLRFIILFSAAIIFSGIVTFNWSI